MRAAILTKTRARLQVVDLKLPRLGVGQVRVKIRYAGICGAQLNEIDAVKGPDPFLPHCLGHEGVGTVTKIGPGVTTVQRGDAVVLHWRPGAGIQSEPPVYRWKRKRVNAGWVTTFQEEAIVSENRVTPLRYWPDMRLAPLLGCALTTAYGVITRDANVKPGESVLVMGVGGVGLPIIKLAALVTAYPIIALDPVKAKWHAACAAGAKAAFHPSIPDAELRGYCGDRLFDYVIDTTGKAKVIERAYALTKKTGKTILVGVPRHTDPIRIHSLPLHFGKVLTGSEGGASKPQEDIPTLARLVSAAKLQIDDLVTHEFPLQRINQALDLVRSGQAGRVLVRMDTMKKKPKGTGRKKGGY